MLYPDIAKQWHPTKNGNLTPYDVTPKSEKRVWWICDKGDEYDSPIHYRTYNHYGCPYCANMRVNKRNCLTTLNPELAKEWHPTKNGELKPTDVVLKSGKRVWWKCENGHEWQSTVHDRSTSNSKCIKCLGRKPTKEHNLELKFPEISKEWHPTLNGDAKPSEFTPSTKKKVWWQCSRGHEYEAGIAHRTGRSQGCPKCSPNTSQIEIRLYCEIKKIFENVVWREKINKIECDLFLPKYDLAVELDGFPWHSKSSKRDLEKNEKLSKNGIQLIRLRDERLGNLTEKDLMFKDGDNEFLLIEKILNEIKNRVSLSKEEIDKIDSYIKGNHFVNDKEYLEITSILPAPIFEKSLEYLKPRIASEWNYSKNYPLTPSMFSTGSNQKVHWICKNNHTWIADIASRTRGRNCPECFDENRSEINRVAKTKKGETLLDLYPKVALEWNYLRNKERNPSDVAAQSHLKVWWKCRYGHEWPATVQHRTIAHSRCPYCVGRKRTSRFTQQGLTNFIQ